MHENAEVREACANLFGRNVVLSPEFLDYLQISGLKKAYRQRLFETHPDRATHLQEDPDTLNEKVRGIKEAYTLLEPMVRNERSVSVDQDEASGTPPPSPSSTPSDEPEETEQEAQNTAEPRGNHAENREEGDTNTSEQCHPPPENYLLFGEFLYHKNLISRKSIDQAVLAQRKDRPRIGEIATEWQFLSREEIAKILQIRNTCEKFGSAAVRMGYLTHYQLFAVLGKQRRLQKPIGLYLAFFNDLPTETIDQLAEEHQQHNQRYTAPHKRRK
mgnify:CR=1 FL=1